VKGLLDEWRNRALDPVYPIVFFDALRVNIRDGATVEKKSVRLALAVRMDGRKELLGLWIGRHEGSKFWLGIMNELKSRGMKDVFLAAVDGLTGFLDAINAAFPQTEVQLCIVHMVRNSIRCVSYKDRKAVVLGLKKIHLAANEELAVSALDEFARDWDGKRPAISKSWRSRWTEVVPFLKFPPGIRTAIYTTNAVESVNHTIQRVVKNRLSFPNDDAAMKLIFMALQKISRRWTTPFKNWGAVLHQFSIFYGDRVPL
jgi:transposase-like protein